MYSKTKYLKIHTLYDLRTISRNLRNYMEHRITTLWNKIKQHKKRVNYTINKHTIDRFKQLCQKRGWIMSVVVENNIKRLVDNL